MDLINLAIQGVGVIAYILVGYSFYKKEKKQILFIQILANIVFGIHYYLLNAVSGAISSLLSAIMLVLIYVYSNKAKERQRRVSIISMIILTIIAISTYENIFSVFPIIAIAIAAMSFTLKDEDVIRKIGVVAAALWLVYGTLCKSYSAMIFETIIIITTIIAIIKNKKVKAN